MSPPEWKYYPTVGLEQFSTTRWNVVLLAGSEASPRAAEALEQLCRTHWYPLYAYLRHLSYGPQDAQRLTEGFFARLLGKNPGALADRGKGRFRSFLLASLNHFLAYERDGAIEANHAGGSPPFSIAAQDAESRHLHEPLPDLSPDRVFERQWALGVLELALARLRHEYATTGNTRQFELLKKFMTNDPEPKAHGEAAAELNVSASSLDATIQRLRQRYRELVRGEIADTVAGSSDIDEETRWLVATLG
jgi:RNA polymerase sigma-70 factor (ECF subfamily)